MTEVLESDGGEKSKTSGFRELNKQGWGWGTRFPDSECASEERKWFPCHGELWKLQGI